MTTTDPSSARGSAKLVRVVGYWWLVSLVFTLLLVQPFEAFLNAQSPTAGLPAFDPFVLLVTLERQRPALGTAVATGAIVLSLAKLCAQVPSTWALVALSQPSHHNTTTSLRTLRALPYTTVLAFVADLVPWLVLYTAQTLMGGFGWLLTASPTTLCVFALLSAAGVAVWLGWVLWFDLARIAVVSNPRAASLTSVAGVAVRLFSNATARLVVLCAVYRAATWSCLLASGAFSLKLAASNQPAAAAWVVAQLLVMLGLWFRVVWLGVATRHAYNLRPPSRNS